MRRTKPAPRTVPLRLGADISSSTSILNAPMSKISNPNSLMGCNDPGRYSSLFPNAGEGSHALRSAVLYMGPDYAAFQTRIGGSVNRVSKFKLNIDPLRSISQSLIGTP
jgi:hypothetical protein